MKTKENAFTLPFMIALYEFMFFAGSSFRRRALFLVPFFLTLLIIPLTYTGIDRPVGEIIGGLGSATKYHTHIPRSDYLFTQFRVIVTYIRLLFLPVNLNFDYDNPVFNTIFNSKVFLSFLFLSSIFGLGVYLLYRSRSREAGLRLVSFGLFWFFISLSVESSIIPIPLLINEYRIYLPSVGFLLVLMVGAFLLLKKLRNKRMQAVVVSSVILLPFVFSITAYKRNVIWQSEVSLWEDVVKKSPEKSSAHNNLANTYKAMGLTNKAMEHYVIALQLTPSNADFHNNLGVAYWSKGMIDKAIEHYTIALRLKSENADFHNNLGVAYVAKGLTNKAKEHFKTALRISPDRADVHFNLGLLNFKVGFYDKARREFETILQINPAHNQAREMLNKINKGHR
jgi:tetratricopeptide (TPR) repeat protein